MDGQTYGFGDKYQKEKDKADEQGYGQATQGKRFRVVQNRTTQSTLGTNRSHKR